MAMAVGWYLVDGWVAGGAIVAAGAVLFVLAVRRHHRARDKRQFAEQLLLMLDESLRRCGGVVTLIRSHERPADVAEPALSLPPILDSGPTWALTGQEFDDLDLYSAPVGVFGLLNRTSTALGSRRLVEWLEHPCLAADRLLARQAAVRWLAGHPQERLNVMAAASALRSRDEAVDQFVGAVHGATALPWPVASVVLRVWSLVTAGLTLYALVRMGLGQIGWVYGLLGLLAVNGTMFLAIRRTVQCCLGPWKHVAVAVAGYRWAAGQAAADLPVERELGKLRDRFAAVMQPGALPTLCRRAAWSDSGGAIHTVFNAMFFWDLHVAEAILRCVLPNREALRAGLSALADLEALTSLACFAYEQPVRCYPGPTSDCLISITGGRHPLITPDRVVSNDVHLDDATRTWVITGSNMSGKSTFLRMVGVNCLLAQIGTAATAERMTWCPSRLITDLQVRDSLSKDESYFLAEVRHLRRMLLPDSHSSPVLGLIDEPFRGTNSSEQAAASAALVEHLMRSGGLFAVATHDLQLTTLADGTTARNRHFTENLDADGLVFDYTLRDGPVTSRCALRILEREGYPADVLARAHEWLKDGA